MNAKSLPERYKHLSYILGDMSKYIAEKIEEAIVFVFFPTHLWIPSLEQDFGSSMVVEGEYTNYGYQVYFSQGPR